MRNSRNVPLSLALAAALVCISALLLPSPASAAEQKLIASDGASFDRFGRSVAIDGDTLVIGAFGDDGDRGAVYVFQRSGDSWTNSAKLLASDGAANHALGISVAIDGDTIVAGAVGSKGASGNQGGAVYTFARTGAATRL